MDNQAVALDCYSFHVLHSFAFGAKCTEGVEKPIKASRKIEAQIYLHIPDCIGLIEEIRFPFDGPGAHLLNMMERILQKQSHIYCQ